MHVCWLGIRKFNAPEIWHLMALKKKAGLCELVLLDYAAAVL
jgi:hypothetical protein